ncbi:hypothetical protein JG687_00001227 [Phytophthora cactorum]|uniref:HTH CENPB-type domain-containing protein n=1 Tax=Phytophthora cactorum TaxID=29920 RepID=A0A329SIQ7_9STRA|nr:hypothetical protein PC114_g3003 [Phytophthora cactorum]KAG2950831.1 hypothetical protein PC117_g4136 [Phytophthora cactorum]KAG3039287.1 hypothetical protein PC119_g2301 [Phytophthora cactorum]KAG3188957.1 hypothetical protein C6341_g2486 [Phytophthora cactorum]KAG4247072.1 hypothetical protein PC116_g5164 [Phytophthora cactorum]
MPRTGRKRTTGSGSKPKTYKRLAISHRCKLNVLIYLDCHTMEDTIARFFPGLLRGQVRSKKRLSYNWKASRDLIEPMCALGLGGHQRSRSRGAGVTLPAAVEEQLVRWVSDLRADGVPVTGMMLSLQAREFYKTTGLPRGA